MTRNETISVMALRGWTLKQIGSVFDITQQRVAQITIKTLRKYDNSLGSVTEFRKHRNKLIATIEEKHGYIGTYS